MAEIELSKRDRIFMKLRGTAIALGIQISFLDRGQHTLDREVNSLLVALALLQDELSGESRRFDRRLRCMLKEGNRWPTSANS